MRINTVCAFVISRVIAKSLGKGERLEERFYLCPTCIDILGRSPTKNRRAILGFIPLMVVRPHSSITLLTAKSKMLRFPQATTRLRDS